MLHNSYIKTTGEPFVFKKFLDKVKKIVLFSLSDKLSLSYNNTSTLREYGSVRNVLILTLEYILQCKRK